MWAWEKRGQDLPHKWYMGLGLRSSPRPPTPINSLGSALMSFPLTEEFPSACTRPGLANGQSWVVTIYLLLQGDSQVYSWETGR